MPKVTQEYLDNKKAMIVESAYRVCLRKPVEMVTISDVIAETGLSQGGIYRFFKDLDEILSAMISNMRTDYNIIDKLDEAVADKDESFATITRNICNILADVMEEHLMDIQKINFDLTVLAINEPERAEKIIRGIKGRSNMEHLTKVTFAALAKASENKILHPRRDPAQIMNYISATYVGIETNCILSACYGNAPMGVHCEPRPLFDLMATTIILLFGGEDK